MKYSSYPSIQEINITTGERSWTFNRSRFSLISQKLLTLKDVNFFPTLSNYENNTILELSKTAITECTSPRSSTASKSSQNQLANTSQSNQNQNQNNAENSPSDDSNNNLVDSNARCYTIIIPNDFSSSSIDSIIKFIYYQVLDITEETAIDIYCLAQSLGLTEVISKTSSYILYKYCPKRIIDTIRACWKRQVDSGPFDRAIEAKFPEFISELHNLPAQKIFNMLKQNHLKVSPEELANLITQVSIRHIKRKDKERKKEELKRKREIEKANEEEELFESSSSLFDSSSTNNLRNQTKDNKIINENENKDQNDEDDENDDIGDFDNAHDILALADFVSFSECTQHVLFDMFTSLGLLNIYEDQADSSTSDFVGLNKGVVDAASTSGAIKICGLAAELLKSQIEMKDDCKQMLSSLEKTASGVQGAAEYQLSIENERGLYTRRNLQASDRYEQIAIEKGDPEIVLSIADKYYDVRKDRDTAFALYSRLLRPTDSKDSKRYKTNDEIKAAQSKCGEHIASRMSEFLGPNNSTDAVSLLRLAISVGEENCCVYGYEFSLKYPNIISEGYSIASLIKVFGDFVVKIGDEVIESEKFANDTKLKSACIPPSVKQIEENAFIECTSLEKVFIPPNVEFIGNTAFNGCSSLVAVRLPRGLKEIGESCFNDCSSLKSIHVAIGCTLEKVEYGSFNGCTSLVTLELPQSLTEICDYAFCGCESLVSLRIPSKVTSIGEKAFMNCKSLEKLSFDDNSSLKEIGSHSFSGCGSLLYLSLPSSLKVIGDASFEGCSSLKELHISFGVETIGESSFYRCESLKKLDLPPSIKYIRDYAFYQCHSLKSLSLPLSLREIGRYVFFQCVQLERISVASFDHLNVVFATANRRSLRFLRIASGPVVLKQNQVQNFENLQEVEIPSSVQRVVKGAFSGCRKIRDVVVETRLTEIDKQAFDVKPNVQFIN